MTKGRCFQSQQINGVCDVCQQPARLIHLPTRPLGFYCELHCPVCELGLTVVGITDRKTGVCVSVRASAPSVS